MGDIHIILFEQKRFSPYSPRGAQLRVSTSFPYCAPVHKKCQEFSNCNSWHFLSSSARRDSNPRPSPWQGDTPPLSHSRTYPQNHILYYISSPALLTLSCLLLPWSSPRPISNSQLHALLHFHLCPIYLVVFKGSYYLMV